MKYMLLLYGDEARWADMSPADVEQDVKAWSDFGRELTEAGALVAGEGLAPTTDATTVRIADGEVVRTDGPFAETREQLGGFYLLDCKDVDDAARWAAKVPDLGEGGAVEVRPVMDYEAAGYEQPDAEAAER
jgi:hypothetical protein